MAFNRRPSLFDDFDREFEEMNRMMDRMLDSMRKWDWSDTPLGTPVYYGVSVDVGPDGVPRVQQFGNVRPGREGLLDTGVREPFTTSMVDEERNQLRVTAEMPGVEKPNVRVEATRDALTLRAEGNDRTYEKRMRLAAAVDPDTAKAKYNNGVLEVTLDLEKQARPKGKSVPVE